MLSRRCQLVIVFLLGWPLAVVAQSTTSTFATGSWNTERWDNSNGFLYVSNYTPNNSVHFSKGSYSIDGMGAEINVGNVVVNENRVVNFTSNTGIFATSGLIRTLEVRDNSVLNFGDQSISNSTGTGFIKTGSGILSTSGGAYSGGFTLNNGTIVLRGADSMGGGAGNTLAINGGTIAAIGSQDLSGKYSGGITIGGNFTLGGATTGVASGNGMSNANLTFSDAISLGSVNRTITIGGTGTYTFSGSVTGSGGVTLANSVGANGQVIFSGMNSYTGTTNLNAGTLLVNGSTSMGSGVNVASGARLGGSGTVAGAIAVLGGGRIFAGSGTDTGTLTVGNTTLNSNAILAANISSSGTNSTFAFGDSTLDLKSGSKLSLVGLTGFVSTPFGPSASYTLGTFNSGSSLQLDSLSVAEGFIYGEYVNGSGNIIGRPVELDLTSFGQTLNADDRLVLRRSGNNLVLNFSPVPEPASVLGVCALLIGGVVGLRKIRRAKVSDITPAA